MTSRTNRRHGFSLIELLIVIAIILIIITVAVPKFQKAQMFARDMGAQKAIQTIHQVEVQYQSQYGRYANSLTELGPPASGASSPASADLIDNSLAGGVKGGYKYTVTGGNGGYVVTAVPETFGTSGSKTWYSDQTMVIHYNLGPELATASSPEVGTAAPTGK
ncbi:MAG TPA: prepilin-type N-terminal cleavage/methylation domain-containing protein [Bryobacteraceae bacterium]|jgi:prepilin-type N-terminal cleavage/methylation domain-containing protein|nr:prepilin-type N-terminal cleavage/methylation domain-containing protein [Bryobacteraceae bacterium]